MFSGKFVRPSLGAAPKSVMRADNGRGGVFSPTGSFGFFRGRNLKPDLPGESKIKRSLDIALAIVGIIGFSPLMIAIFFLVRRDGGPAIFSQKRIGKNGEQFNCYKFRTMVVDAETVLQALLKSDAEVRKEWNIDRKLRKDPRITSLGRFLRRKSFDELPQLWNVLKGDMSIVGPRPVIADEIGLYGDNARFYYLCRPGLTGLWQVSGRNNVSYEERVALDSQYAQLWSLSQDIRIIGRTFGVVINGDGAH
ncbi:MAG: sugar transferase [Pseudomonadota bacterium]